MEKNVITSKSFRFGNSPQLQNFLKEFPNFTLGELHTYMAAVKYLEDKGLTLILTHSYVKRGSIGVVDPQTKRRFSITANGFIRTYVKYPYFSHTSTYQLNPQQPLSSPFGYMPSSRITFPGEYYYMATLLWKSIKRIRKIHAKNNNIASTLIKQYNNSPFKNYGDALNNFRNEFFRDPSRYGTSLTLEQWLVKEKNHTPTQARLLIQQGNNINEIKYKLQLLKVNI